MCVHTRLYSNEANSVQCVENDFWLCVGANSSSVPQPRIVDSDSKRVAALKRSTLTVLLWTNVDNTGFGRWMNLLLQFLKGLKHLAESSVFDFVLTLYTCIVASWRFSWKMFSLCLYNSNSVHLWEFEKDKKCFILSFALFSTTCLVLQVAASALSPLALNKSKEPA